METTNVGLAAYIYSLVKSVEIESLMIDNVFFALRTARS
jgi:hypothetical protein